MRQAEQGQWPEDYTLRICQLEAFSTCVSSLLHPVCRSQLLAMEPENTPHSSGKPRGYLTDQSRLTNLIQKERMEEINRSLPLSTPQQEELRTTISLKTPHAHIYGQHLKLNMSKTELISTTKTITPPAFSISININIHLHAQAKKSVSSSFLLFLTSNIQFISKLYHLYPQNMSHYSNSF